MSKMSQTESVSGNAEKPPTQNKKEDSVQGKYWKVNYHLKENESFEQIFKLLEESIIPLCAEYIFSEEYGSSGKTRHIEGGFITREDRKRRTAIQKVFKFSDCQKSKKNNWGALVKYCSKEGNKSLHSEGIKIPKPLVKLTYEMLRKEQREIADLFIEDEDPLFGRKVYWFWEKNGNWGKSILCKYMIDNMGAFVVQGKNNDILCGITNYIEDYGQCPRIVIFDIPRVNDNHVSYQAIESLKNGFFFSGKYESAMVRFNSPHILVFSNEEPEEYNLSKDRWIIKNLNP